MRSKNLGSNMILNMLRTGMSIIFPLITFPYATRVLGVLSLGKVSYTQSFINYLLMIAALGVSNYASREGGYLRREKRELTTFVCELYSLNLLSTAVSYILLGLLLLFGVVSKDYYLLILIQSISIFFATFGVDWVNVIYEEYAFITIRTLVVQSFSLLLLFALVHSSEDYIIYAGIQVASNALLSIINRIHLRRYISIKIQHPNIKRHLKPILVLFSNNIAVQVYCNADITMTGIMFGDYYVGIYSLSSKIYAIMKQVIAAAYTAVVTRMSEYYARNEMADFKKSLNQVINSIIFLALPMTFGVVLNAELIIHIIAGDGYAEAQGTLCVLACTVMIAVLGGALAYCVNMPMKKERVNLVCTAISAVENIVLNLILMKYFGIMGAAIATLISELTVVILLVMNMKGHWDLFDLTCISKNTIKSLVSCMPIFFVSRYGHTILTSNSTIQFVVVVLLSAAAYFIVNLILRNEVLSILSSRILVTRRHR